VGLGDDANVQKGRCLTVCCAGRQLEPGVLESVGKEPVALGVWHTLNTSGVAAQRSQRHDQLSDAERQMGNQPQKHAAA
jgi:hypothetical protein